MSPERQLSETISKQTKDNFHSIAERLARAIENLSPRHSVVREIESVMQSGPISLVIQMMAEFLQEGKIPKVQGNFRDMPASVFGKPAVQQFIQEFTAGQISAAQVDAMSLEYQYAAEEVDLATVWH